MVQTKKMHCTYTISISINYYTCQSTITKTFVMAFYFLSPLFTFLLIFFFLYSELRLFFWIMAVAWWLVVPVGATNEKRLCCVVWRWGEESECWTNPPPLKSSGENLRMVATTKNLASLIGTQYEVQTELTQSNLNMGWSQIHNYMIYTT